MKNVNLQTIYFKRGGTAEVIDLKKIGGIFGK
jgi:hypothetical protein